MNDYQITTSYYASILFNKFGKHFKFAKALWKFHSCTHMSNEVHWAKTIQVHNCDSRPPNRFNTVQQNFTWYTSIRLFSNINFQCPCSKQAKYPVKRLHYRFLSAIYFSLISSLTHSGQVVQKQRCVGSHSSADHRDLMCVVWCGGVFNGQTRPSWQAWGWPQRPSRHRPLPRWHAPPPPGSGAAGPAASVTHISTQSKINYLGLFLTFPSFAHPTLHLPG